MIGVWCVVMNVNHGIILSVLVLPVLVHLVQLVMYVLVLHQYGSVLLECSFLLSCQQCLGIAFTYGIALKDNFRTSCPVRAPIIIRGGIYEGFTRLQ